MRKITDFRDLFPNCPSAPLATIHGQRRLSELMPAAAVKERFGILGHQVIGMLTIDSPPIDVFLMILKQIEAGLPLQHAVGESPIMRLGYPSETSPVGSVYVVPLPIVDRLGELNRRLERGLSDEEQQHQYDERIEMPITRILPNQSRFIARGDYGTVTDSMQPARSPDTRALSQCQLINDIGGTLIRNLWVEGTRLAIPADLK